MHKDCCCDKTDCKRLIEEGIVDIRKGIKEICESLKSLERLEKELHKAVCVIDDGLDGIVKGVNDKRCCNL